MELTTVYGIPRLGGRNKSLRPNSRRKDKYQRNLNTIEAT